MGFDVQQQRKLNNYHQKNIPVELINCEVKSSKYGEGYEVMLKGGTHIKESPKKASTQCANTEILRDCHVFGTLAKQA